MNHKEASRLLIKITVGFFILLGIIVVFIFIARNADRIFIGAPGMPATGPYN